MKPKTIYIEKCTDSMLWYAKRVGEEVEYLGDEEDFYWSRDNGGYKNIVYKKDARLLYGEEDKQEVVFQSVLMDRIKVLENQVTSLGLRVYQLEMARANNNPFTYPVSPWKITYHTETVPQPPWVVTCKTDTGQ